MTMVNAAQRLHRSFTLRGFGGRSRVNPKRAGITDMRSSGKQSLGVSSFTLIELLTVLVLVSILIGMGAGVASKLGRTGKAESSVRKFTRMLMLSRQVAITKNRRVALVLPMGAAAAGTENGGTIYEAKLPADLVTGDSDPCIAMRPVYCNAVGAATGYVEDSSWVSLDSGSYLCHGGSPDELSTVNMSGVDIQAADGSWTTGNSTVSAIIFEPNGTIRTAKDITNLYIRTTPTPTKTGARISYQVEKINWLTGKPTIKGPIKQISQP